MKSYHFFPVFLALLGSYIALHFYSAAWLARNFALSAGAARTVRLLFLLLAFFAPFTMFLRHRWAAPALDPLYIAGYSWMGVILVIGFTFLCSDLLALGLKFLLSPSGMHNFRLGSVAFLGLLIPYAFYNGLKVPPLKEVRCTVPGLPPGLDGLKIAQLSDMHVDSAYKLGQFSAVVDLVNARKPDLVLVTGDLVDPGLTCSTRLGELVRKLKPRLGVYGVFGNHEYYYGYEKSLACYKEFGIKLLMNESVDLADPEPFPKGTKGATGLRLIGLGDIMTEKMTEKAVGDILEKNRKAGISILMSHQPIMLELMSETGDYIGFSGHTHRGQIFPFHIFTRMVYKHFYGLYRLKNSFFYVTSGAGTWGPPLRLFAPSEIPVITLTRDRYGHMMSGPI